MGKNIEFIEYENVTVRKYMEVEISDKDFQLLEQGKIELEDIADKYNDEVDCYDRQEMAGDFESYGDWKLSDE